MLQSLWTGISGISTQQQGIDTTSSNISNVNTVAYKKSRVSFSDHVYQDGIGKGSYLAATQKQFEVGNITVTYNPFDIALDGEGFLTVDQAQSDGSSKTFFTRAGNLKMGSDGTLQDANGNRIQGWAMNVLDVGGASGDVVRTNENLTMLDGDYSKSLSSQLVYGIGEIISINIKSTDYKDTAQNDDLSTYNGSGYKTLGSKLQDIDLIKGALEDKLVEYASDPTTSSVPAVAEVGYVDFYSTNPKTAMDLQTGDSMSVYIDGEIISQAWYISDNLTMRALADKISAETGLKAYMRDDKFVGEPTPDINLLEDKGTIIIEKLIPGGDALNLGEASYTSAGVKSIQESGTVIESIDGSGQGAVDAIRDALMLAVRGVQRNIWEHNDAFPDTYEATYLRGGDPVTLKDLTAVPAVADGDKLTMNYGDKQVSIELTTENTSKSVGTDPLLNTDPNDPIDEFNPLRTFSNDEIPWDGTLPTYSLAAGIDTTTTTPFYPATLSLEPNVEYTSEYDTIFADRIKSETRAALVTEADEIQVAVYDTEYARLVLANDALTIKRDTNDIKTEAATLALSAKYQILGILLPANNGLGYVNGLVLDDASIAVPLYYENSAPDPGSKNDPINAAVIRAQDAGYKAAVEYAEKGTTIRTHALDLLAAEINADTKETETGGLALDMVADVINERLVVEALDVGVELDIRIEYYSPSLASENGGSVDDGTVERLRDLDISIPSGAGAHFMQIKTTINQKSSQNDLQLVLETLGISSITGGDFTVKENGLITIKQGSSEFAIGQISVGTFKSIQGLDPVGSNLYEETDESGSIAYTVDNASMATVKQDNLELSNADLSQSLVNLIIFQRAFEASAKSVTTSDSMLQTLIDLKR